MEIKAVKFGPPVKAILITNGKVRTTVTPADGTIRNEYEDGSTEYYSIEKIKCLKFTRFTDEEITMEFIT